MKTIRFRTGTALALFGLATMTTTLAQTDAIPDPTVPAKPIAGGAIKDVSITPGTSVSQDSSAQTILIKQ